MENAVTLSITMFCAPMICVDGQQLHLATKKGEALLYYLLLEKKASRDRLITLIWENEPAEQARRHLRDTLYLLRRQLGDVITALDRYTLSLNAAYPIECDALRLEDGDISVYRGEFLRDFHLPNSTEYELWVERCRERFRTLYLQGLEGCIIEAEAAGQAGELEDCLRRYLQEEPLSESMTVRLMQLYRSRSEYSKVAAVYQRLYQLLSEEMGIAPLKETASLYYDIMEEWNARAETDRGVHDEVLSSREADYDKLKESLANTQAYRAVVLSGASGVGKTHVLHRLITSSQLRAYFPITASCYKSKQNVPFYAWQSIFASLSQLNMDWGLAIPEVYLRALMPSAAPSDLVSPYQPSANVPLNVALMHVVRIVAKHRPLLLVFENIQWMDAASLNMLDEMMRQIGRDGILTLATCCPPFSGALASFLEAAQEDGMLQLHTLLPFTREETFLFVEQYSGGIFSEQTKERIYQETNGNAFMLISLLDYLKENGSEQPYNLSVKEELTFRTNGLGKDSLNILNMIAMFPEYVPYEVLCQLSRKSTVELLPTCHDLSRRMIVTEYSNGGQLCVSLARPEYRDYIYESMPPFDREVFHRAIVDALYSVSPNSVPDRETMLEYHCRQSGDLIGALEHRTNCVTAYVGGTYDLFQLQNIRSDVAQNTEEAIESIEEELHRLRRERKNFDRLNKIWEQILYLKAIRGISCGNYTLGLSAIHEMLLRCGGDPHMQIIAHRQMSNYAIQIHNLTLLEEHVSAGLACAQNCGDWEDHAAFERYRGLLYVLRGNYPQAREVLAQSLKETDEVFPRGLQHDAQASYTHNYIGDSYWKEGNYGKALEEYETALKIIEPHSYMTSRPIFYTGKGQALLALKRYDEAVEAFERSTREFSLVSNLFAESVALSFSALFAYAEEDEARTQKLLHSAEEKAEQYQSLYSRSILELVRAALRKQLDREGKRSALSRELGQPYAYYASQAFLYGNLGHFERELLTNLFSAQREEEDMLYGLWQWKRGR